MNPRWAIGAMLAAAVIAIYGLGILVERNTDLDTGQLLLYLTTVGALLAAFFTSQQARTAHMTLLTTQRALDPHLTVVRWYRTTSGIVIDLKNSGAGTALNVEFKSAVAEGRQINPLPAWASVPIRASGQFGSIGAYDTVRDLQVLDSVSMPSDWSPQGPCTLYFWWSCQGPFGTPVSGFDGCTHAFVGDRDENPWKPQSQQPHPRMGDPASDRPQ